MGEDAVGDGMVGPVVGEVFSVEGFKFFDVRLFGAAIGQAGAFFWIGFVGSGTGEVHGDGGVSASGPQFGPDFKSGAAAAVDEDDGGKLAFFFSGWRAFFEGGGRGVVGEDAGGSAVIGFAGIGEAVDGGVRGEPLEGGWRGEFLEIPGGFRSTEEAGEQADNEEKEAWDDHGIRGRKKRNAAGAAFLLVGWKEEAGGLFDEDAGGFGGFLGFEGEVVELGGADVVVFVGLQDAATVEVAGVVEPGVVEGFEGPVDDEDDLTFGHGKGNGKTAEI